jgi:hypothetical protein
VGDFKGIGSAQILFYYSLLARALGELGRIPKPPKPRCLKMSRPNSPKCTSRSGRTASRHPNLWLKFRLRTNCFNRFCETSWALE